MNDILKKELTPYKIPFTKIRCGRNYDGGYVIFNHRLNMLDAIYSYGINDDVSFELDIANHTQSNLYLYDHTIHHLPCDHPRFIFTKEAGSSENIVKHVTHQSNIFLKLDIEGSEWELIENVDKAFLEKFEQLTIEFHNIQFMQNEYFGTFNTYELMIKVFKKLNEIFYLGHIHGNNIGGMSALPNTIECTYIRKDILQDIPEIEDIPYPIANIDYPDHPGLPDYYLDWWIVR